MTGMLYVAALKYIGTVPVSCRSTTLRPSSYTGVCVRRGWEGGVYMHTYMCAYVCVFGVGDTIWTYFRLQ